MRYDEDLDTFFVPEWFFKATGVADGALLSAWGWQAMEANGGIDRYNDLLVRKRKFSTMLQDQDIR